MPMNVSPGLQQREEHGLVGLRAGMRLHVGEAAIEQLAGALDRELLGDVDKLAAAVIAPAGIALGIFVGEHRALRLEHGARDDVLRGDQLDLVLLAVQLAFEHGIDLGIGLGEARGEHRKRHVVGLAADWNHDLVLKTAWRRGRRGARLRTAV